MMPVDGPDSSNQAFKTAFHKISIHLPQIELIVFEKLHSLYRRFRLILLTSYYQVTTSLLQGILIQSSASRFQYSQHNPA